MKPLLEAYGVTVVALSTDTVDQVGVHARRGGLSHVLLADPKLEVIGDYGLIHHKGLQFSSWSLAGIPLGAPVGMRKMAIPTTLLVDEDGVVRWIDQAEDYRLRGDEPRIRDALAQVFGPPPS